MIGTIGINIPYNIDCYDFSITDWDLKQNLEGPGSSIFGNLK